MSRKHGDSTNDLTNGSKVTLIMVQNPEKTPPENVRKLNFGLRNMRLQNVESCSSQFSGLRASDCQSVVAQIIWSKIRRSWSFFSEPSFSLVSNMLFSSLDGWWFHDRVMGRQPNIISTTEYYLETTWARKKPAVYPLQCDLDYYFLTRQPNIILRQLGREKNLQFTAKNKIWNCRYRIEY